MAADEHDLANFIEKVDEIDGIIKGLAAADVDHKEAIIKADEFLNKVNEDKKRDDKQKKKKHYPPNDNTGFNKSVINQKAFDELSNTGPDGKQEMSQESFMSAIEEDARQRAIKKSKLKKEATIIKDKGNEEFKKGNYIKATEFYTEALSKIKDYSALWTNRAQSYIKLGEFEKALGDCDWALKVSETCLKAYIHKGRALAGLHRYEEALDCFKQAVEVEPSKEKAIMEYIRDVELQKKATKEEKLAKESFDSGDFKAKGIVEILEKLNQPDQLAYYYSGGLRLVKEAMKDTKERTLFRTSGGLHLTESHQYISKCMAASARSLSKEELDLCATVLETYLAACTDNEENQRIILELEMLPEQILKFLESKWKLTNLVKEAALNLLFSLSQDDHCRVKIVSRFDLTRLLSCLFTLMKSKEHTVATTAVGLLNNLALAKKFKIQLREKIVDVLPAFENAMTDDDMSLLVLPSCISSVTNLCGDGVIRRQLQIREEIWKTCSIVLDNYRNRHSERQIEDLLFSLLGLLMNMTLERSENLQQFAVAICHHCAVLLTCCIQRLEERSCGVLSHVLPHSEEAVNEACQAGIVPNLLNILKNVDNAHFKFAVKTLTVCTQHNHVARETILKQDRGLKQVYDLLKHEDEQILGNASLCLSHCATLPNVSSALAKTNVMMDLLVLARDGKNTAVRHNCAILIAKLTQSHHSHLERLRELDGLGILHDVMKHVKE